MLGKMGKTVSSAFQDRLNAQIAAGTPTYLFLTTREGWKGRYVTYRCPVRQVYQSMEAAKLHLVPAYYRDGAADMSTWFEITAVEPLTAEEMDRIVVLASGRRIMSVVSSTATTFHVGVEEPLALQSEQG